MKRTPFYYAILSSFIVTFLVSCSPIKMLKPDPKPGVAKTAQTVEPPPSHKRAEKTIELTRAFDPKFQEEKTTIKADTYKPDTKIEPKILVILVPGTGKVSRRGEMSSDGINKYQKTVELFALWGKALADQGLYVLAYDKRTCTEGFNNLCVDKKLRFADEQGIEVLARDLDNVYDFALNALKKMGQDDPWRIILMGHTQSAQVIALSTRASKASGLVLLSPITESLDTMLVRGFEHAHRRNEAEGQKAFFSRLDKGEYAENASFFGANVKLWKSWLDASRRTMPLLSAQNLPTLMLFSEKDVFSSAASAREGIKKYNNKKNFSIKIIEKDADRNLLDNGMLAEESIAEVIRFAKALKPSALAAK